MGDMNVVWVTFLYCAGNLVISFGLSLLALAAIALFLGSFTQGSVP